MAVQGRESVEANSQKLEVQGKGSSFSTKGLQLCYEHQHVMIPGQKEEQQTHVLNVTYRHSDSHLILIQQDTQQVHTKLGKYICNK